MNKSTYKMISALLKDEGDTIDWNACVEEWFDTIFKTEYPDPYSINYVTDPYSDSISCIIIPTSKEGMVFYSDKYFVCLGTDKWINDISRFTHFDMSDMTKPKFTFDFMEDVEEYCLTLECDKLNVLNLSNYLDLNIETIHIYNTHNECVNLEDLCKTKDDLKYVSIFDDSQFGIILDTNTDSIEFILSGAFIHFGKKDVDISQPIEKNILANVSNNVQW